MPSALNNTPTADANTNGVMSSVRWDTLNLTYSFPTSSGQFEANYGPEPQFFTTLSNPMQDASRQAFAMFAQVSSLTFTEITETTTTHADMRSSYSVQRGTGNLAHAYYPSPDPNAGDAWYMREGTNNTDGTRGSNDYATVIHELGHALGLKHPHEADGAFAIMPAAFEFGDYSVMSYRSTVNGQLSAQSNETYGYGQTPMMYDVAALQAMYGANFGWQSGNTTYTWSTTTGETFINGVGQGAPGANRVFMNLWDGGGRDTFDLSAYTTAMSVDLAPGGWSTFSQEQRAKLVADGSVLATGNVSNSVLYNNDLRSLIEDVIGGTASDIIRGNQGENALQGRGGADTLSGFDGNDRLLGDGAVMLTDNALAVRRIYIATLGRGPDDGGLAGWSSQIDGGRTLAEIVPGFLDSPEFTAKYGPLDNTQFVTALYQNVLNRAPDTGGLNAWVAQLNGGNSRASVVLGFSESPEFKIGSDPENQIGQVYRLYAATLAREPDTGGLLGWANELGKGKALTTIAAGFVDSPEFTSKYGNLDNTQFVTLLYQNVLGRAPDQGGLDNWVGQLNGGTSRTQVVTGFSESAEFKTAKLPGLITFMRTADASWIDSLDGGAGNDAMAGGLGGDTFVFNKAALGTDDHIYSWDAWDQVQFAGFGYADAAAALSKMTQMGDHVVFADQGETITFHTARLTEMSVLV